tara:strand:- start:1146 stop:1439 length:294 start_codon:yes stop_codon:yes gene_type:complete
MKNIKKFSVYFFATIGFIVVACSAAADDNPDNAPIAQTSIGKYQMVISGANNQILHVINTETGKLKSYYKSTGSNPTYNDANHSWTYNPEGDLTVTH